MSFILDALKKSENERQRHVGASLADVQIRRRRHDRPWWAVAVAGLLVINLGVLLVVLMGREADAPPAAAAMPQAAQTYAPAPNQSTAPQMQAPAPEAQAPSRTLRADGASPAVRSLADEAESFESIGAEGAFGPDLAAASAVPEGPPLVRQIQPYAASPVSPPRLEARTAESNEILPTHSDLIASGTTLPELHLDIHVHSGNPAERFVFVNMRKYVEGQTLNEGPAVERITSDGVVLNHRGLRFLLPRQ